MALTKIRGTTQIMAGTIDNSLFVSGLNLPTNQLAEGASFVKKDGTVAYTADQSLGGFKLTNLADATNSQDAVNLRTAQALINGISIKQSCRVVAVANLTLSGLQTVDGKALVANDRVLLSAQTTSSQNGIWLAQSGSWTRSTDYAAASTQKAGIMVLIAEGTVYQDTKWLCTTDGSITVDTTNTIWTQDQSGINYTNGNGLSLTGNTFAVKLGNGVQFDGSNNVALKLDGSSLAVSAAGLKVAGGTGGQAYIANASGDAAWQTISGDFTLNNSGVASANTTTILTFARQVNNEIPAGSINGSNTAFTLANTPKLATLKVFFNGQLLDIGAGNDFTISGTTITMAWAPTSGDKIRAFYDF